MVKNLCANAGDIRDACWICGSGRSLGGGHVNSFQYSCLKNPIDRGAWWAIVHRVAKSWTWLKWLSRHACTHADLGSDILGQWFWASNLTTLTLTSSSANWGNINNLLHFRSVVRNQSIVVQSRHSVNSDGYYSKLYPTLPFSVFVVFAEQDFQIMQNFIYMMHPRSFLGMFSWSPHHFYQLFTSLWCFGKWNSGVRHTASTVLSSWWCTIYSKNWKDLEMTLTCPHAWSSTPVSHHLRLIKKPSFFWSSDKVFHDDACVSWLFLSAPFCLRDVSCSQLHAWLPSYKTPGTHSNNSVKQFEYCLGVLDSTDPECSWVYLNKWEKVKWSVWEIYLLWDSVYKKLYSCGYAYLGIFYMTCFISRNIMSFEISI